MTTSVAEQPSPGRRSLFAVILLLFLGLIVLSLQWGGTSNSTVEPLSLAGPTMGTRYSIRYFGGPPVKELQPQVDELLKRINEQMSTYDPESELSQFNQSESSEWFKVSPETAKVVAFSLEMAEKTEGAFDPTVGPAVNLWGFGPEGRITKAPSDEEIAAALARIGYQKLEARLEPPALRKSQPDIYVDLSAVAKGYGVDAVTELLATAGVEASMVEIGGEVRTRGRKPGGVSWRIGIEQPEDDERSIRTAVALDDASMATSGDYRNFFQQGGVRYSHTIQPQTARPVQHDVATVTVVTPTCMEADAVATSLLVLGEEAGYDWCKERDVAATFLIREKDDTIREHATPAFAEQFPEGKSQP